MHVGILGAGYVGLVTAVSMVDHDHTVTLVDLDPLRVSHIQEGRPPFHEPGLATALRGAARKLTATTDVRHLRGVDVLLICTGTHDIVEAAGSVRHHLDENTVVLIKSTAIVGTTDVVAKLLAPRPVFANPEFLREGQAMVDVSRPDRIVVGGPQGEGLERVRDLFEPWTRTGVPFLHQTAVEAELTKSMANAFLSMKISFANQADDLCRALGADTRVVTKAMGLDPRIGSRHLRHGPGFGGSCLPKDLRNLIELGREQGAQTKLLDATLETNETRSTDIADRIARRCGKNAIIGFLGISFKPDTDDVRESRSVVIATRLRSQGLTVRMTDPIVAVPPSDFDQRSSPEEVADGADALVLATPWEQYRHLDLPELRQRMRGDLWFDLHDWVPEDTLWAAGFTMGFVRPGPTCR